MDLASVRTTARCVLGQWGNAGPPPDLFVSPAACWRTWFFQTANAQYVAQDGGHGLRRKAAGSQYFLESCFSLLILGRDEDSLFGRWSPRPDQYAFRFTSPKIGVSARILRSSQIDQLLM